MTTYYSFIIPITHTIPADRQGAKRYYGVHPYFTRRPYNVIKKYILHYSREGDCVLDPFGGSGVTAIEAFLENRTGIQNDINPLANFIANSTVDLVKGKISDLYEALSILEDRCKSRIAKVNSLSDKGLAKYKRSIKLPENVLLPKTSDVGNYHDLFSLKQMLSLAILKKEIDSLPNKHSRSGMLLAWSATLGKLNKTFLSAEGRAESRGGSSIFSIYRYKIAGNPVELPPWESFYERAINIINAKKEIDKEIEFKKRTNGWRGKYECYSKDVEDLTEELEGTIDYIFTDPPYGGNISYIDLSILWNSWLGFLPDARTREKELIVGGELKLSEKIYKTRLYDSIKACVRMLKTNRWFSIVFQHWNVSYFEAILNSAHDSGAELKAAISQVGDPIWSMHKKKMKESVLAC